MPHVSHPKTLKTSNRGWGKVWLLGVVLLQSISMISHAMEIKENTMYVYPGDSIQEAIRSATTREDIKTVIVKEGVYRPAHKGQALLWFNRHFNGIHLKAKGKVVLTAANPDIADPSDASYPAVVNHVIYFGVGVDARTVVEGFRIEGANGFVTTKHTRLYEPSREPRPNEYFYHDGGGIKIFGDSSPVLRNLEIADHFTSPCGAGISIQQEGAHSKPVLIENCILRNNRTQVTGAAIDLLPGSSAVIRNCLFVENVSNIGVDVVSLRGNAVPFTNNGVLTVFATSSAVVERCTFVNNRNGIDDMGGNSRIIDSLFWNNKNDDGLKGFSRFDLDLANGGVVMNNTIQGPNRDPQGAVGSEFNPPITGDPQFDKEWVPQNSMYEKRGYRPLPNP